MGELKFGLLALGDEPVSAAVEQARAAEEAGFDSIWCADNPFLRGGLPTAVACAAATRRVRIGVGVVNPYNRHPTLQAMEIPAFDEACGGRAVWGLGASVLQWVEEMGLPYDRPLSAVRDTIEIIRQMLRGEVCRYQGRVFSVRGAQLDFTPTRAGVPIYLGSMAPRSLVLCGEVADGWVASVFSSPAYGREAMRLIRQGAERAGRSLEGFDAVYYLPACIAATTAEAERVVRPLMAAMLRDLQGGAESAPAVAEQVFAYAGMPREEFQAAVDRVMAGDTAGASIPVGVLEAFSIYGDPERAERQLRLFMEAGMTEFCAALPATGDKVAMIRFIGREVIPRFRGAGR